MKRFYPLEKLINLNEGYRRRFKIDNRQLLLIEADGERWLVEANCPHQEHPLDEAPVRDAMIECPHHRYRFSLTDGCVLNANVHPCRSLQCYELVYEGNEVGVMLEEA